MILFILGDDRASVIFSIESLSLYFVAISTASLRVHADPPPLPWLGRGTRIRWIAVQESESSPLQINHYRKTFNKPRQLMEIWKPGPF